MRINEDFLDLVEHSEIDDKEVKVNTNEHEFDFRIFMNANLLCLNEETRRKIERFLECAPFVSNFRTGYSPNDGYRSDIIDGQHEYLAILFDGKFRTLSQFILFLKFLRSLRISYVLIYTKRSFISTSISVFEFFEVFNAVEKEDYSFRNDKQWVDTKHEIASVIEDLLDNPIKAVGEFYEMVLDDNEYEVTFNMPADALNWDYFVPVEEHILRNMRLEVRRSKINFDKSCTYFVYSDVGAPDNKEVVTNNDMLENNCINHFRDSHFKSFYLGCDYDAMVGVLWGRLGLMSQPTDKNQVMDIVFCILGDLGDDTFKNNLKNVLPGLSDKTADKFVQMCKEEADKQYSPDDDDD